MFHLLCDAGDVERARRLCPEAVGTLTFPDLGADDGVRYAFCCTLDRAACAVLSHEWPYEQNTVFVCTISGLTVNAVRAIINELRAFLEDNSDVCRGLHLNATSVVQPPPGYTIADVFTWFRD